MRLTGPRRGAALLIVQVYVITSLLVASCISSTKIHYNTGGISQAVIERNLKFQSRRLSATNEEAVSQSEE